MSRKLSGKEKFHLHFITNLQNRSYIWSDVKKSWMTDQEKHQYNNMLKQQKYQKENEVRNNNNKPISFSEVVNNLEQKFPLPSLPRIYDPALSNI